MATDVAVEVMKRTIAIALLFTIAAVRAGGQEYRPMVVEDLFNLQAMTDVRMSPDGTSIAVVIQRAWSDPETYRPYAMFGNDHADVWILPAAGGPPRNITHGRKNGSGYWNLVWSPDGERLALLSTEGGDNIRAYVWEKRSGQLKRVADRGVDTRARTNAIGNENPLHWVDNNRLLVIALPEREQPWHFRVRRQTRRIESEAWRKVEQGQEPATFGYESNHGGTTQSYYIYKIIYNGCGLPDPCNRLKTLARPGGYNKGC